MYFVKRYNPKENKIDENKLELDQNDLREKSPSFKNTMTVLIALSFINVQGFRGGHVLYSPTYYQYLPIGITASKAAQILSVFSLFFTIGRFVAVFETQIMSTELMITIHSIIALFSEMALYFGQNSETVIWIANVFFGNFNTVINNRIIKLDHFF